MIDLFPILTDYRGLVLEDFARFSLSFAEIIKKRLPTAQRIHFLGDAGPRSHFPQEWLTLLDRMKSGNALCAIGGRSLMFAFAVKGGERMAAVVEGADPLFLKKVGMDWLEDARLTIERELILLKEARIDVHTGLLNLWNLYSLLESPGPANGLHLILIELPPKRMDFRSIVRYSRKCAALVQNCLQGDAVLHSIGQSTFALVLPKRKTESRAEVESGLVAYLKREGCHKVHIGSSISANEGGANNGPAGRSLLDEAWTALRHAEKRGPFSFCDYRLLAHPEQHAFVHPGQALVHRLSRLWRQAELFSLVHFQGISRDSVTKDAVWSLIDRGIPFQCQNDVLVYLDGVDAATARDWAQTIIERVVTVFTDLQVSAGVSSYPYSDFKKSEMVLNCRKALLHASFFGTSSAVVFDSVSLNISGDIYFGDGDLARAVREYRRGLKCDNRNINLHNSLGVALAMMDKLGPAMQCFENALAIDGNDFMALYNLGLAEQGRGRISEAYAYLEKALAHYTAEDGGQEIVDDLKLQLGMLAGELGKHQQALTYLLTWQEHNEKSPKVGRVLYHLGKAYHDLGDNRRAMVALQRALKFNEFDDRAMDLLGRIYLHEGEGDEIALALCRKSVELEPGNIFYRCNLAEIQVQCGMVQEARENLYRCLQSKKARMKAQVLFGRSLVREGWHKRAKVWFRKALDQGDGVPELLEEASRGVQEAC